jgi:hypothetical protein
MENLKPKMDPDASPDPVIGWTQGEFIRALRTKLEELDRACAALRESVWQLRRVLGRK